MVKVMSLVSGCLAFAALSAHAGGPKRTGEECAKDDDCNRGHCHTKKDGPKVCVDCTPSEISRYRDQVERYCKDEPRKCQDVPQLEEAAEEYFKIRIENNDRCAASRGEELQRCWDGGDEAHKAAIKQVELTRKICYDELNTRKGMGGIYTCSDSTYSSRASDVKNACGSYGRACDEWAKDDKVVDCSKIEDAQKTVNKCIESVERIDSDCLPSLSRFREVQFRNAKNAYDVCKDILGYKKDKKLCK